MQNKPLHLTNFSFLGLKKNLSMNSIVKLKIQKVSIQNHTLKVAQNVSRAVALEPSEGGRVESSGSVSNTKVTVDIKISNIIHIDHPNAGFDDPGSSTKSQTRPQQPFFFLSLLTVFPGEPWFSFSVSFVFASEKSDALLPFFFIGELSQAFDGSATDPSGSTMGCVFTAMAALLLSSILSFKYAHHAPRTAKGSQCRSPHHTAHCAQLETSPGARPANTPI